MSPDSIRCFLSVVAESMAALFALGAIFAIYRLEEINTQVSRTCSAIREFVRRNILFDLSNPNRKMDSREVDEWLDKDVLYSLLIRFDGTNRAFTDYYTQLNNQLDFRDELQRKLLAPTCLMALTFLMSIVGLLLSDIIKLCCLRTLIFSLFILVIITTLNLVYYAKFAIAGPEEEILNNPLIEEFQDLRTQRFEQIANEMKKRAAEEKDKLKGSLEKKVSRHMS